MLLDLQRTGIELGGRGRAQAAVERVADVELQFVGAIRVADVDVGPAGGEGLDAAGDTDVGGRVEDLRQEAVRVDGRNVARVPGRAEEAVGERLALRVQAVRIE